MPSGPGLAVGVDRQIDEQVDRRPAVRGPRAGSGGRARRGLLRRRLAVGVGAELTLDAKAAGPAPRRVGDAISVVASVRDLDERTLEEAARPLEAEDAAPHANEVVARHAREHEPALEAHVNAEHAPVSTNRHRQMQRDAAADVGDRPPVVAGRPRFLVRRHPDCRTLLSIRT
jgi:hypothetical protein